MGAITTFDTTTGVFTFQADAAQVVTYPPGTYTFTVTGTSGVVPTTYSESVSFELTLVDPNLCTFSAPTWYIPHICPEPVAIKTGPDTGSPFVPYWPLAPSDAIFTVFSDNPAPEVDFPVGNAPCDVPGASNSQCKAEEKPTAGDGVSPNIRFINGDNTVRV